MGQHGPSAAATGAYAADKHRPRVSIAHLGWLAAATCLFLLYAFELVHHLSVPRPSAAAAAVQPSRLAGHTPPGAAAAAAAAGAAATTAAAAAAAGGGGQLVLPAATLKYFPQAARCTTGWMQEYAQLHADVFAGAAEPRHLVSVAVEAGLADRLTGMVTQFWHAVLTRRAFSAVTYGDVPSFAAACDTPFFDWATRAPDVPEEALEPLRFTYRGVRGYPAQNRSLPGHLDPADYGMLYLVNGPARNLTVYQNANLSALVSPDPATLLAASNRGRSFTLAGNPWHRRAFWEAGVAPADAFMCGFFFMCSPVPAIQRYYARFWDALRQPGVLTIGIQVRVGDQVFSQGEGDGRPADEVLAQGAEWFACAEKLQAAYAAPGQKVLWYLNSDSRALRRAAKDKYGDKLVTDDALEMTHPDCYQDKRAADGGGGGNATAGGGHGEGEGGAASAACKQQAMDEALQHSLGAMLTFSMADYHVISRPSGFGRLGAWMSGRWGNIYQVVKGQGSCVPGKPVPPEQSAFHYSGV